MDVSIENYFYLTEHWLKNECISNCSVLLTASKKTCQPADNINKIFTCPDNILENSWLKKNKAMNRLMLQFRLSLHGCSVSAYVYVMFRSERYTFSRLPKSVYNLMQFHSLAGEQITLTTVEASHSKQIGVAACATMICVLCVLIAVDLPLVKSSVTSAISIIRAIVKSS